MRTSIVIALGRDSDSLLFYTRLSFISYLFIWVRGTLPRLRYDKLIYFGLKDTFAFVFELSFFLGIKLFIF
jgi:NADH-ubiquinone oxidoreductase chain 1